MTLEEIVKKLSAPGARIPWLWEWLITDIWSIERYGKLTAIDYLREGEKLICSIEEILSAAADRTYTELIRRIQPDRAILNCLSDKNTAVIIFDGLSLRELPLIHSLATKSGYTIKVTGYSLASLPSETNEFINDNLGVGRIGPSQLHSRKELKEKGIKVVYAESSTAAPQLDYNAPLLVWSAFPDNTYFDSDARFAEHFENMHALFETAWINLVQAVRNKKRLIITSDHGYVFFGTGLDTQRSNREQKILNDFFGNDRNKDITGVTVPDHTDIFVDSSKNVAVLKGRVKTHSSGTAGQKLYKHGGLSLMEMLTPWVEMEVSQ